MKLALRKLFTGAALFASLAASANADTTQPFVHPGILQSQADLDRMKKGIESADPTITVGFKLLRDDRFSQSSYKMKGPGEAIGRAPNVNFPEFNDDAAAAYQNALMWRLTGDRTHATKAKEIVNAWGSRLKRVTGRDGVLMAGFGPFLMINAAELLRYSDAGWTEPEIRQFAGMLTNAIYPEIKDFALFANGNWDEACERTMLAIAVFCDDRDMFERALRYYCNGAGNGRLRHYIINEVGQAQESGRDHQHLQLGLGLLGDCCQISWNQGLDLFGYESNRLLHGFEYTAKYLIGEDVPFKPMIDRTGKYPWNNISERSGFRPIYEQIYNHYVNRAGLSAPFTERAVLEHTRPEGAMNNHDHTGFGTLLYAQPKTAPDKLSKSAPVAPGAIVGHGSPTGNRLTWIAAIGATDYTVKRSANARGPYTVIAREIKSAAYTDTKVAASTVHYYVATARNSAGESVESPETGICAGLPKPWSQQDVGAVSIAGSTEFDGRTFMLNGSGTGFDGTEDQFQFVWQPMNGDGAITVRFVPQMSGMLSEFGLMMRETPASDSPRVALFITPKDRRNPESPGYVARFQARAMAVAALDSPRFGPPFSEEGRMLGYCWLRLVRKGGIFSASYSPDGETWTQLPETKMNLNSHLLVGLAVSSTNPRITTTVIFDNVQVSSSK